MTEIVTSSGRSSARLVRASALVLSLLVASVLLALSFAVPPRASTRLGALAERLVERITREESVSIRIDAERRMVVDSATPLAREQPATKGDWLVLDRRWLSGEGGGDVTASGPLRRDSLSYVGAVMSADSHVAITPPFVVLTRGRESVLLRLDAGQLADGGEVATPDWIRTDAERGLVVARFGGFSDIEIGADTVRLQRRFLDW